MFSASLLLATSVVQRFSTPRAATSGAVARRVHGIRAGIDSFEVELFSPAKVSLFLRILGRRDDGFHEMASLCQTVDLGDRLRLARIPAGSTIVRPSRVNEPIKQHAELTVTPPDPTIPCDETNLVVRALALFRNRLTERDGGSLDVPRFRGESSPPSVGAHLRPPSLSVRTPSNRCPRAVPARS